MVGFLDLPPELHYEIASYILPPPPRDYRARFPAGALAPEFKERLQNALPGGVEEYDGLAETARLVVALDCESGEEGVGMQRYCWEPYTMQLCRFLRDTFLILFQQAIDGTEEDIMEWRLRSLDLIRSGFAYDRERPVDQFQGNGLQFIQWNLAAGMVQSVLDTVEASDSDSVNAVEFRFWRNFISLCSQDATAGKYRLDGSRSDLYKLRTAYTDKLHMYYEDEQNRRFEECEIFSDYGDPCRHAIFRMPNWNSTGSDSGSEALMNWLKKFAIRGSIVKYSEYCPENLRPLLVKPKQSNYWFLPETILLVTLKENITRLKKRFDVINWEWSNNLAIRKEMLKKFVLAGVKTKVVRWICSEILQSKTPKKNSQRKGGSVQKTGFRKKATQSRTSQKGVIQDKASQNDRGTFERIASQKGINNWHEEAALLEKPLMESTSRNDIVEEEKIVSQQVSQETPETKYLQKKLILKEVRIVQKHRSRVLHKSSRTSPRRADTEVRS
ncbi:hypothetical protein BJ508DRAFT_367003 [Ascobolus immersus RN42]|uniref:Uncharacterized protein n=1 Tax=Ascobolus immersus RN42 TaxID=1160509 RepID=A0A3N4HT85_ASCIM|nr:hypothetical protein BJ508DRAFT_367003 [Ascobolus immersus RN42]